MAFSIVEVALASAAAYAAWRAFVHYSNRQVRHLYFEPLKYVLILGFRYMGLLI